MKEREERFDNMLRWKCEVKELVSRSKSKESIIKEKKLIVERQYERKQ